MTHVPITVRSDQSLLSTACSVPCPSFEGAFALYLHAYRLLGYLVVELTYLARVSAATF